MSLMFAEIGFGSAKIVVARSKERKIVWRRVIIENSGFCMWYGTIRYGSDTGERLQKYG
jgi:hypothetical protein